MNLDYVRAEFVTHPLRLAPTLTVWAKFGEEPNEVYDALTKIGWTQGFYPNGPNVLLACQAQDWMDAGYPRDDNTVVVERQFLKVGADPLDWAAEEKKVFLPQIRNVLRKFGFIRIKTHVSEGL